MFEYILKLKSKKIIPIDNLFKENKIIKINIIIYHLTINSLYPFVQFMLYNNKDKLILPFLYLNYNINIYNNLKYIIIQNITKYLIMIKTLNNIYLTKEYIYKNIIYDGIILDDDNNIYICIDISNINIQNLLLNSNSSIIFSLYSEIVNQGKIYDIIIDNDLIYKFSKSCYFALLKNNENNEYYPFPQVGYYCNYKNITELYSILGYFKEKIYDNLDEYLFFHKESKKSLKYFKEKIKNEDLILQQNIIINRISLFIENDAIYEYNNNNYYINIKYDTLLLLFFDNINNYLPNILVKNNLYINTLSLLYI